jgi:exonuclease 3'-5' domain-containing protein 1
MVEDVVAPAITPEAAIGINAMRCAELAAAATPREGRAPFEADFARRVDSARHVVRKLIETTHEAMSERLYTHSGLQGLVAEIGTLLEKIALQDGRKLKSKRVEGFDGRKINNFPTPKITVGNTPEKISRMIDEICSLDHGRESPQLSIDVEGAKFHRHGDISIIQVSVQELDTVYLVDVHTLGKAAFDVVGNSNPDYNLKAILESSSIPKLMFDCRTDNDVLLHIVGVRLAGVIDLQLLFVATRTKPKDRKKVPCLSKVTGYAGGLHSADKYKWNYAKNWGYSAMMIGPDKTMELIEKSDGVWGVSESNKETGLEGYPWVNHRPMSELVKKYCVADVVMLPAVYEYCISHRFWNEAWAARVEKEMKWRLGMADAEVFEHNLTVMQGAPPDWDKVKQVDKTEVKETQIDDTEAHKTGVDKTEDSGVEMEEGSRETSD